MHSEHAARKLFPAGLHQPAGSFRFSVDALLLAAFAAEAIQDESAAIPALDLGCGCGVVGLGLLLLNGNCRVLGVDIHAPLVQAACDNARYLGLAERFEAATVDFANKNSVKKLPCGIFALAAANPPFREVGAGRLPPSDSRRLALFSTPQTLPAFLDAARRALAPQGVLALIYPAEKREALWEALAATGFAPSRVLPVRSRHNNTPIRLLVLARREPLCSGSLSPDEEPLTLFRDESQTYSTEAVRFCPFLRQKAPQPAAT